MRRALQELQPLIVYFKPGYVGDGGWHAEGQIHQERQQQGPDHHESSGGRRACTGQ